MLPVKFTRAARGSKGGAARCSHVAQHPANLLGDSAQLCIDWSVKEESSSQGKPQGNQDRGKSHV
uniref:Uncharacterized protein n=1 Tax=Helianthus annuus TaxID=4232 RepID=A0A251TSY4_HELAN